jgi:phage baseplate assembly protein W
MAGFGTVPLGVGPYGVGTPATATDTSAGKIYRDEKTGDSLGSRKIDTRTRQYVFDSYGRIVGMPDVAQLVQIALSTTKGSSVIAGLGHELSSIEDFTTSHAEQVRSTIERALGDLIKRKLVRLNSVDVQRFNQSGAVITVKWTDLTTQREEESTV